MRIGLIGCGNVGVNAHIPAAQANEGLTIVAAADPTPERIQAAAAAAGLGPDDLHADWRQLIARADVEAVIVATPQRFRPEIVIAAASAGKHVLAEKPLALTPADARAMIDAAREHGVTLATVHNYHFMPVYRDIKEVLDSGEIGQPEIAVLNYLGVEDRPGAAAYSPRWRHRAADSGGGVLMDMLHVVYLANWFMDGPPLAVSAWVDRRLEGDGDVEDIALVRYVYENGQALINMAWGVGPGGVEIGGTRGRVVMTNRDFGTHPFVPAARLDVVAESGSRSWTPRDAVAYGMAGIVGDFRDAVAANVEPVASGESGLRVLDAVLGAYVSGALGDEVALPLPDDHPVYAKGSAGIGDLGLPDRSPVLRRGLFGVNHAQA
ncbi:MAG TPA: Gfo/Idh/MocA family oxidoreductase [Thermomicrobiales bacterium]|nr:Gfo/Idh/MocA family oxidoreductase [Thermomicrobiales bacterium]